ncbi:hypothetical protein ACFVOK_11520 [Streptomyces sp. NPDC057798]|uniref:hypothetical protein n=1 Tax=Streptomyces sp. NPDC057798 TaxID=3346252 RepID=UPI0036A9F836
MAYGNSSAVLAAPAAHPLANPGYGKRSAPDQRPPRPGDFGHLPPREAYLASLIDQLCENAAMDAKTLAKVQPLYGQQAVRTALNELGRAGHLRRVRRRIESDDGSRWVFLTHWSRTARDNEWWARFLEGDVEGDVAPETVAETTPTTGSDTGAAPSTPSTPSAAYAVLAQLGLQEPRLALSSADCAALEQLAAEWLARGVAPGRLSQILVVGLPDRVHSPRAFVRRRLVDKLPPHCPEPAPGRVLRVLVECTDCGAAGRSEALPGGLCRACDGRGRSADREPTGLRPQAVRDRAAQVRALLRTRSGLA